MNARLPAAVRPTVDPRRLIAPLALCLLVGAAFVSLDIPGESRFRHALQNAGHGLAFAALALVSLLSLGVRDERRRAPLTLLVGGVALVLFALGAGIEIAQHLTGRGANASDLLMNLGGIVSGSALAFTTRRVGPVRSRRRSTSRLAALAIGTAALLWCLRGPIAITVVDAMAPELPLLDAFEQPFALARLGGGSTPAALALVDAGARWPANRTTVLEARFPAGRWPGFRLIEPPPDWRAYRTLLLDVVNTGTTPVRVNVRVDQRAKGEDIFWTAGEVLEPGPGTIEIELAAMRPDVALEPGRADHVPFRDVFQVLVFLSVDRTPVTLLFDDIRLER